MGETLPVIVLSGDTSAEIEALSHEVDVRFMSKPIAPESLVAQVQELLSRRVASRTAD
jgi:DNA-binding response OmpR family regulator